MEPGIQHQNAKQLPSPLRGGRVCWEGWQVCGEGCRQAVLLLLLKGCCLGIFLSVFFSQSRGSEA